MNQSQQKEEILKTLIEHLDLPETAYEKAVKRYKDLGEWFNREDSKLRSNDVHIFPQGSFLLGTSTRPLNKEGAYDLDLACKLRVGVSKSTHSQKKIKEIVGSELEMYRQARGIQAELVEKHRCWCLEYRDSISFHMDIVPAIPESEMKKSLLFEAMNKFGIDQGIAKSASDTVLSITDDRDPNYNNISEEWKISNPEGYGVWFSNQMITTQYRTLLEKAQVDKLPLYKYKTPLQRCVQLLKRHRDTMFSEDDSKPISSIITTLAARAYKGETNISVALNNILNGMLYHLNKEIPRVPNPVNPNEDFADKWAMPQYSHLKLEQNFFLWLKQAQLDFQVITSSNDVEKINEQFTKKFSVKTNSDELKKRLNGLADINASTATTTKMHIIKDPIKPWKIKS